ncbi:aspartate kinase [Jeotgalibacillus sp. R-1-5s-1]|uniref:aspartate kinase n=1 Tax=Jeotgalibacillus sp. R-1-5s-1 TaxID=2555897 RepID=UPI00106A1AF6|nr:aspartate kinase [Jeotgalibacillus sp. R-1-5s-1]TFE03446.1 aspartate kinase [Jeotgalibacillus sp. R-1-5s-1]
MTIIVQKFGGTSLTTAEKRNLAAIQVEKAVKSGKKVVAVVSAMGRHGDPYATDSLLSLIDSPDSMPDQHQALLLSCGETISAAVFSSVLHEIGLKASVITGREAGIHTDRVLNASITKVNPEPILKEFASSQVVVLTGFQGMSPFGEVSTLGRGGSDATACAIAAALDAEACQLFTDVEGIMSGDPSVIYNTSIVDRISYDEACHIAYQGAKVIHPKAIEWARSNKVPLWTGALDGESGTWITERHQNGGPIQSVTAVNHLVQVIVNSQDCDRVFTRVAQAEISIDLISIQPNEVKFTVDKADAFKLKEILLRAGFPYTFKENVSKIALIGERMAGKPGITSSIVSLLTKHDIKIWQTADSHMTFWILTDQHSSAAAQQLLHYFFIESGAEDLSNA